MDENVIRLDATTIEELKRKKLLRERQEAVELDPVGPGESMIGVLTEEERIVFSEMALLRGDIDGRQKELTARALEMFAAAMRKSDKPEQIEENIDTSMMFPTEEDAKEFFALETHFEYLKAIYNSSIRDRYGHHAIYGVRSGFNIVRIGYKYRLPGEAGKRGNG